MSENIKVSIMFATSQELKSDMSAIIRAYKKLDLNDIKNHPAVLANALTYLIHQQGYKLEDAYAGLYGNDVTNVFIQSVCDAVQSNPSTLLSELCCVVTMPINEAKMLSQKLMACKEYLCIAKETEMFLFNEWMGAGSSAIQLEKAFEVPARLVSSIHIAGDDDCFVYDRTRTKIIHISTEHPLDMVYSDVGGYELSYTAVPPLKVHEKGSDVFRALVQFSKTQAEVNDIWTN